MSQQNPTAPHYFQSKSSDFEMLMDLAKKNSNPNITNLGKQLEITQLFTENTQLKDDAKKLKAEIEDMKQKISSLEAELTRVSAYANHLHHFIMNNFSSKFDPITFVDE